LSLFRSRGFTAGAVLATLSTLVVFGLLYAKPQYFRDVVGTTPMGSGVRLLPTIGGLLVGLIIATGLQRAQPAGHAWRLPAAKSIAELGFTVMAAGVGMGASTSTIGREGFTTMWFAVVGLGLGLVLPTVMNAALALSPPSAAASARRG
jgi:hypothetical protein